MKSLLFHFCSFRQQKFRPPVKRNLQGREILTECLKDSYLAKSCLESIMASKS